MFAIQITYHYDPSVIIEGGHQVRVMEFFVGRFTNCRHEDAARSSMYRKAVTPLQCSASVMCYRIEAFPATAESLSALHGRSYLANRKRIGGDSIRYKKHVEFESGH